VSLTKLDEDSLSLFSRSSFTSSIDVRMITTAEPASPTMNNTLRNQKNIFAKKISIKDRGFTAYASSLVPTG